MTTADLLAVLLAYWFIAFAVMMLIHTRNLSFTNPDNRVPPGGLILGGVFWFPIAIAILVVAIYEADQW